MCGAAIMRVAQMLEETFTRAFWRVMPWVWAPLLLEPRVEDGVTRMGFWGGMVFGIGLWELWVFWLGFWLVNCCCLVIGCLACFSTSEEGWRYLGYGFILYGGHGMRTKESSSTIHLTLSLTDVT